MIKMRISLHPGIRHPGQLSIREFVEAANIDPKTYFRGKDLRGKDMYGVGDLLAGSDLRSTVLENTCWPRSASLYRTRLEGANLRGSGLPLGKIAQAYISICTLLPDGMDFNAVMARHKALGLGQPRI